MDKLTEDQVESIRTVFSAFADDQNERITERQAEMVIRTLDCCPSKMCLDELIEQMGKDEDGYVIFEDFISTVGKRLLQYYKNQECIEEIFARFDKHRGGCLNASVMNALLTSLGEKFSQREFQEFLIEAEVSDDGLIFYRQFAQKISKYLITAWIEEDFIA